MRFEIPPPHELVDAVPASPVGSEGSAMLHHPQRQEQRQEQRQDDVFGPIRSRDYAYPAGGAAGPDRGGVEPVIAPRQRTRTMSGSTRGSTRISQYDLVSPPRGDIVGGSRYGAQSPTRSMGGMLYGGRIGGDGEREREGYFETERSRTHQAASQGGYSNPRGRRGGRDGNEQEVSPTQRIVDDWRSANPPDPPPHDYPNPRQQPPPPQQIYNNNHSGEHDRQQQQQQNDVGIPFPSTH